jgi:hypothetical protein
MRTVSVTTHRGSRTLIGTFIPGVDDGARVLGPCAPTTSHLVRVGNFSAMMSEKAVVSGTFDVRLATAQDIKELPDMNAIPEGAIPQGTIAPDHPTMRQFEHRGVDVTVYENGKMNFQANFVKGEQVEHHELRPEIHDIRVAVEHAKAILDGHITGPTGRGSKLFQEMSDAHEG